MPDYRISALTWNMGNEQVHGSSIQQLSDEVGKEDPDIILISAQEAKESRQRFENLSERIAKRQGYQLLHQTSFRVFTKVSPLPQFLGGDGLNGVSNLLKPSRTHFGVLIKPGVQASISYYPAPGKKKDGINKGGQYAVLKLGSKEIGIIGAHLDSNSPEKRQREAKQLIKAAGGKKTRYDYFYGRP
ncbi:endonuclease/exonuclease/phosphatase family protein [Piscirickettsia litoralis]|uniref:endonuclease/exonuclease/phosphatase family protein n=1 Tax=Piscirickettsia litoralis TaxID=1891921 RepID=UPI001F476BC5|nr:hypothetical protein [Piscirickettsia litoralis]